MAGGSFGAGHTIGMLLSSAKALTLSSPVNPVSTNSPSQANAGFDLRRSLGLLKISSSMGLER